MKTGEDNGLLLWLGKAKSPRADYMSVAIVNGYAQFSFKQGQQNDSLVLTSRVPFELAGTNSVQILVLNAQCNFSGIRERQ